MVRNILIFGDPSTDRRFVLRLLGVSIARSDHSNVLPPAKIFETQTHLPTNTRNKYKLYNTAGLESDVSKVEPRDVLGHLCHLIGAFNGGDINLLIYVVSDEPSLNNIKLFHDFLCRRDVPMILITSTPHPSRPDRLPPFKVVLTIDSANPLESDKADLREAILLHLKRDPKEVRPVDRFKETAIKSWELLGKAAGWSIPKWRGALKATLIEDAFFSEQDAATKCQDIVDHIKEGHSCNVIVFGDTGAGKTSVIKMLSNEVEVSAKASSAGGSTFESKAYDVDINDHSYVFHDTVGLEDGTSISMSPKDALIALYQLMLKVEGGINLLVYVHRGKIKPSQVENYRLFSHVLCQSKVPTALVVTGLEEVDSMDDWWEANKALYDEQEISTEHYACITSTRGKFHSKHKEYVYQDQYEESQTILKALFLKASLLNPWKIPNTPNRWKSLVVEIYNIFAVKFKWKHLVANESLYHDLLEIGVTEDQAKEWVNSMNRVLPNRTARP